MELTINLSVFQEMLTWGSYYFWIITVPIYLLIGILLGRFTYKHLDGQNDESIVAFGVLLIFFWLPCILFIAFLFAIAGSIWLLKFLILLGNKTCKK